MDHFPPEVRKRKLPLSSNGSCVNIVIMSVLFLRCLIGLCAAVVAGSVCELDCPSPVMQPSQVVKYCTDNNLTLTDNHRCCVNSTSDKSTDENVVGVDLRNCSLQNTTDLFKNMTSLVVITLDHNPLTSVAAEDFYELTKLDYLSLPLDSNKSIECPGEPYAWNNTVPSPTDHSLICQHQLDTCNSIENNETCPSPQSYCTPAGPGLVDCLCSPGYHGYKCLRQGTFPLIPFVGGIGGSTVVISIILWVTQRRNVKKHTS